MRDFQEAKDLRLVVTLSKGTRAGAAIAMDDIKVIFRTIFETRHSNALWVDFSGALVGRAVS